MISEIEGAPRTPGVALSAQVSGSIQLREPVQHARRQLGGLFPGGVGKTDSPELFASLMNDVEQRIFDALPDDTWFYPGHGDDSTLGVERPKVPEWRERGW